MRGVIALMVLAIFILGGIHEIERNPKEDL